MKVFKFPSSLTPILLSLILLVGCSGQQTAASSSESEIPGSSLTAESQSNATVNDTSSQDETNYIESDRKTAQIASLSDSVSSSVTGFAAASAETILLETSEGHLLYDVVSGTTLASLDTSDQDITCCWFTLESGFCSQETAWGNSTTVIGNDMVFYDESLQETSRIDLEDLTSYAEQWTWAVSNDGTMLSWFDFDENELYLYNCTTGEITTLLSGQEDLTSMDGLYFDSDNSHLVFLANYFDGSGEDAVAVWGTIALNGSDPVLHSFSGIKAGGYTKFQNGILLCQEDSFSITGKVCVIDVESGEETVLSLQTDEESENPIILSQDGAYFVTKCGIKGSSGDSSEITVRLYDTKDGDLLEEYKVSQVSGSNIHFCILDSFKTVYISAMVQDSNRVFQFSF